MLIYSAIMVYYTRKNPTRTLSMAPINRLDAEFMRLHISWTRQRNEVYQTLNLLGPCQVKELSGRLKASISERTTRRTIELFLAHGIATRITGNLIELVPPHAQPHHYLVCQKCGRRIGFNDEILQKAVKRLATRRRFTHVGTPIEIRGICETCT
jgi:Fe2+ or Zn2+ uptake regulation protein